MGNVYSDYRLRLRLLSPLGTPMQSDTFFGHLAWLEAWRGGEAGVAAFLEPFLAGSPPFVLSDAFPEGLLPRPLFPSAMPDSAQIGRARFGEERRRNKAPFVSAEDFTRLLESSADAAPHPSPWITVETLHARMDRNTDTTTPGGDLYVTESQALEEGFSAVDVYVRELKTGAAERVAETVNELSKTGFGRDKSSGLGVFKVDAFEPWNDFAEPSGADGFVSLSTFMPAANDPMDGRWRLRVKRGYLGEMAGDGNPFKRTMIQIEPGAVFQCGAALRPWYGRMVSGIAPGLPGAVQCGLTLSVACRWTGQSG